MIIYIYNYLIIYNHTIYDMLELYAHKLYNHIYIRMHISYTSPVRLLKPTVNLLIFPHYIPVIYIYTIWLFHIAMERSTIFNR